MHDLLELTDCAYNVIIEVEQNGESYEIKRGFDFWWHFSQFDLTPVVTLAGFLGQH